MHISSDIHQLTQPFQSKIIAFLDDAHTELPNLEVFETKRSEQRQAYLFGLGRNQLQMAWYYPRKKKYWAFADPLATKRTWTIYSKHLTGQACDFIFRENGKITWKGDWDKFREIAKKHGLKSLYPIETCHLEWDEKYNLTLKLMKEVIKLAKQLWSSADRFKKQTDEFQDEMVEIQDAAHDIADEARK